MSCDINVAYIADIYLMFSMVESSWAEDMGQFIYHLDLDTGINNKNIWKITIKIINSIPTSFIKNLS